MIRLISVLSILVILIGFSDAAGLYGSKNSNVIELNADNFAREVFGSPHVWLVEFYAPWCGHCKKLTPEWEAAATKLKGLVKVAAVNCDDEKNKPLAGYFGIQGFPTIKAFGHRTEPSPDGKGVIKKPTDYNSAREAAAIISYGLSLLPSEFVIQTKDDAAFSAWQGQHGGAPAILLFTDKTTTTSLAKALSLDFAGRLPFVQVNSAAKQAVASFGVSSFPTIVVSQPDGSHQVYSGKLEHKDIFDFISKFAPASSSSAGSSAPPPPPPPAAPAEPFQVWHLTDQEVFQQKCLSKKVGLCVIALLDALDEESFDQYSETFEKTGEANQKKFHFMWADGPSNIAFGEALGINSYPGLAVYSPSKKSYVPYPGAFEQKKIEDFLASVLVGKKRSIEQPDTPTLSVATKPKTEL